MLLQRALSALENIDRKISSIIDEGGANLCKKLGTVNESRQPKSADC